MTKYYLRRFLLLLVLVLFVVFVTSVVTTYTQYKIAKYMTVLDNKSIIHDHIKLDLRPRIDPVKDKIFVDVIIQSYQNSDAININLNETVILEDQDLNLFVPKIWTISEEDMYHKKGVLEFFPIPDNLETLTITFFGVDDMTFVWDVIPQ